MQSKKIQLELPYIPKNVAVGDIYRTIGGWNAQIVYITANRFYVYAIHKSGTSEESHPIMHNHKGTALPQFTVGAAPTYGEHQPGDIIFDKQVIN